MRKLLLIGLICFVYACGDKPTDLSGDAPIKINDLVKVFNDAKLPVNLSDTSITKYKDSIEIGRKALSQIVPDTTLEKIIASKNKKATIHPLFKIEKETEYYLLIKIKQSKKEEIGILVFNKENKFLDYKSIIEFNKDKGSNNEKSLYINNEPSFLLEENKYNKNNVLVNEKKAWAFSEGVFKLIYFDNVIKLENKNIINPIDTLPSNNVFSGDFESNSKNFITIRDNGASDKYQFFLHTEKTEGCVGELKGMLQFKNNVANFSEKGDACHIQFTIQGNNISIKEDGNCGNHRGLNCSFDENFNRKKRIKRKK
ncbi:MAG: hypothetical protein RLZ95_1804 [Bacteroidota bacterium]|jgi:hypothetical protein